MRYRLFILSLIVYASVFAAPSERLSSYPYITGDSFRSICDFIVDETENSLIPEKVKKGDIIFLKTDYLGRFFTKVHPNIKNPYILVTHNSALPAPGNYESILEDPKLIAWFAQNVTYAHPKLRPIPLGIANRHWPHGCIEMIEEVQENKPERTTTLLYMNFALHTCYQERKEVFDLFKEHSFCRIEEPKEYRAYLKDLCLTQFVLSPRGMGIDTHRTWEALLMGAIPIVKRSQMDAVFERLPVLLIDDWSEVTEEFLHQKWEEFQHTEFQLERLYADYWFEKVLSAKPIW